MIAQTGVRKIYQHSQMVLRLKQLWVHFICQSLEYGHSLLIRVSIVFPIIWERPPPPPPPSPPNPSESGIIPELSKSDPEPRAAEASSYMFTSKEGAPCTLCPCACSPCYLYQMVNENTLRTWDGDGWGHSNILLWLGVIFALSYLT